MPLQMTFGSARGATRPPARNAARRRLTGLPRRWWERAHSCLQLCELGDHILADFDLQDILTVVPELRNRPLRPQWLSVAIGRLFVRLQVGSGRTNSALKYTVILSGTYRFGSAGALSLINWPKRVR
jgi:uncharacterized protein YjiS (DUF1127 family)